MNIRLNHDQQNLLKYHATMVRTPESDYFFLPYWFKVIPGDQTPDGSTHEYFEMCHLNKLPEDLKEGIKMERGTSTPLITEQFLISKGWSKKVTQTVTYFYIDEQELGARFRPAGDLQLFEIWRFSPCAMDYSGLIPTESQYEVLNQLLKLHP